MYIRNIYDKNPADILQPYISILCPTRQRPDRLSKMVESCLNTADNPEQIEFVLYIDDDDEVPTINNKFANISIISGPRIWLSGMHNACASVAQGEILMWAADDICFVTSGWDTEVMNQFKKWNDGLGLVFPNDLSSYKGTLATHAFVKKEWLRAFGSLVPPYLPDVYTDNWITYLAESIGRITYLEDIIIEHLQYRQGKANYDETYKARALNTQVKNYRSTFLRLYRERRNEIVIVCFKYDLKIPFNYMFILGWAVAKSNKLSEKTRIKLLSTPNHDFFRSLTTKLFIKIKSLFLN